MNIPFWILLSFWFKSVVLPGLYIYSEVRYRKNTCYLRIVIGVALISTYLRNGDEYFECIYSLTEGKHTFGCWHVIAWLLVTWMSLLVQVICLDWVEMNNSFTLFFLAGVCWHQYSFACRKPGYGPCTNSWKYFEIVDLKLQLKEDIYIFQFVIQAGKH
jgi:hypothetical protein